MCVADIEEETRRELEENTEERVSLGNRCQSEHRYRPLHPQTGGRVHSPRRCSFSSRSGLKPKTDALVPPMLTEEHSLFEYKAWKRKWKTYFDASGLEGQDIRIQRSFLDALLNTHLSNLLRDEALEDSQIYAPNRVIEKLDSIFKRFYPLFVRHAKFWNLKQKPGQKYSEAHMQTHWR